MSAALKSLTVTVIYCMIKKICLFCSFAELSSNRWTKEILFCVVCEKNETTVFQWLQTFQCNKMQVCGHF